MYAYSNHGASWRKIADRKDVTETEVIFDDHPGPSDLEKAFPKAKGIFPVMHRIERNRLLQNCDWTQLPDSQLNDKQRKAWGAYRQALRDLPANTKPGADPIWPKPPE